MDEYARIRYTNKALAERINRETLADPSSPYAGKYLGIANGEVVVVGDNRTAVSRRLREIEPDSRKVWLLEASRDYSIIEYV